MATIILIQIVFLGLIVLMPWVGAGTKMIHRTDVMAGDEGDD